MLVVQMNIYNQLSEVMFLLLLCLHVHDVCLHAVLLLTVIFCNSDVSRKCPLLQRVLLAVEMVNNCLSHCWFDRFYKLPWFCRNETREM